MQPSIYIYTMKIPKIKELFESEHVRPPTKKLNSNLDDKLEE